MHSDQYMVLTLAFSELTWKPVNGLPAAGVELGPVLVVEVGGVETGVETGVDTGVEAPGL